MAKTTIPVNKNINKEQGAIVLSITDITKEKNMHLITLGKISVVINFDESKEQISIIKNKQKVASVDIHKDNLDIVINWSNGEVWLNVYTQELLPRYLGSTNTIQEENIFGNNLSLFEDNYFNGTYQSLTSYSNYMEKEDLSAFSLEVFKESTEVLFMADFTKPTHYEKNIILEDTFAPKDGSPILLSDDKGPLYRQYFFDQETAEYQNEVVERFLFKGEKKRSLAYENIEPSYKTKVQFYNPDKDYYIVGEGKVSIDGQELLFNLSSEDVDVSYGYEYEITYQLERSYNIEFNEDVPHDGFRVNLVNMKAEKDSSNYYSSTKNIEMTREGNPFEEEYLAKEIELNPLINPQVQGFMYIDNKPQKTNAFRISASSQYIVGNGIDTASIMVEAIDDEGNEVLSPYLTMFLMDNEGDVSKGFGSIEPIIGYNSMKARNTSGRAYYRFTAPILLDDKKTTYKIFIVALDRKSGISAQYPIYIQTVNEEQIFEISTESNTDLNIPFEYFARYFEKDLTINNPMIELDFNKNGRLDRQDLNQFIEYFKENSPIPLNTKLIELESSLEEINITEDTKWEEILTLTWEDIKDKIISKNWGDE